MGFPGQPAAHPLRRADPARRELDTGTGYLVAGALGADVLLALLLLGRVLAGGRGHREVYPVNPTSVLPDEPGHLVGF